MPDIILNSGVIPMETIIIIAVVALIFGASAKNLIDRIFGTVDTALDVADQYLVDVKADQKQTSKLKREENHVKHIDRLAKINAKRAEKNLPAISLDDFKQSKYQQDPILNWIGFSFLSTHKSNTQERHIHIHKHNNDRQSVLSD